MRQEDVSYRRLIRMEVRLTVALAIRSIRVMRKNTGNANRVAPVFDTAKAILRRAPKS